MNSYIKQLGKYTYGVNKNLSIHTGRKTESCIYIGAFCSIAKDCKIILNGEHNIDGITTFPLISFKKKWPEASKIKGHPKSKGDVIIGNDVGLGMGVTILSGVKIGDGAIIGSEAVVTKDIEPYSIVGGVPAKHIKYRFEKEQIDKLLEIKGWNGTDEKIRENIFLLSSSDINEFIIKHYKGKENE